MKQVFNLVFTIIAIVGIFGVSSCTVQEEKIIPNEVLFPKIAEIYTTEDIFYIRYDVDNDTYRLFSEKQGGIGYFLDKEYIGRYITNEIVLANSNNPLD